LIGTLHSSGGFARSLNCGQQERDQNSDDRNNDKKFNESESSDTALASPINQTCFSHNTPHEIKKESTNDNNDVAQKSEY